MILFLKHAAMTVFLMAGFLGSVLAIASFSAQGMSDAEYDDSAKRCGIWSTIFVLLCVAAILALSGCAQTRAIVNACRDGHCY